MKTVKRLVKCDGVDTSLDGKYNEKQIRNMSRLSAELWVKLWLLETKKQRSEKFADT